jgi:hypothetical protein
MTIDISDKDIAGSVSGNFDKKEVKPEVVKQEVKQPNTIDPKTSKLFGK